MSAPAEKLLRAIQAAQSDPLGATRLATVTNGTSTTLTVRFDGEAVASTRAYMKTFGPVAIGDRVIMLRTGSTWTAIGRVPVGNSTAPDTGAVTVTPDPGVSSLSPYGIPTQASKRNGWVFINVEVQLGIAYSPGYGLFFLPAGYGMEPGRTVRFNCGSPFAANRNYTCTIDTAGTATIVVSAPATEVLLGSVAYPSAS